jgi:hypothetical protein
MAAESVHGALRAMFLVPVTGDFRARQIGAIAGSFIVLALAYLLIDWVGAESAAGHLLAVGAFWLVLTLGFEFGLGRYGFGYSWQRILEDYDIRQGGPLAIRNGYACAVANDCGGTSPPALRCERGDGLICSSRRPQLSRAIQSGPRPPRDRSPHGFSSRQRPPRG